MPIGSHASGSPRMIDIRMCHITYRAIGTQRPIKFTNVAQAVPIPKLVKMAFKYRKRPQVLWLDLPSNGCKRQSKTVVL